MTHMIFSLPEPDGTFTIRCACGWTTTAPDHRASLNATRNHKEDMNG